MKFFVCLMLLSCQFILAQQIPLIVRGIVCNTQGEPIPYVNVQEFVFPDSIFVKNTLTNVEGKFELKIEGDSLSKHYLKISALGFETQYVPVKEQLTIQLAPQSQLLQEAIVYSPKQSMKIKKGNLICQIANTALSNFPDVQEILGKLPGLTMEGKELRALAKGAIEYYINKRKSTKEEVLMLDVKQIKNVEVDLYPGSRFGAEVAAVIYIHTLNTQVGFNGLLRSNSIVYQGFTQSLSGDFNYKNKLFDINLNLGATAVNDKSWQKLSFSEQTSNSWSMDSKDNKDKLHTFKKNIFTAVTYNPSKQQQFRLSYKFKPAHSVVDMSGNVELNMSGKKTTKDIFTIQNSDNHQHLVNYYHQFNIGEKMQGEIIADYLINESESSQILDETETEKHTKTSTFISLNNGGKFLGISPKFSYNTSFGTLDAGAGLSLSNITSNYKVKEKLTVTNLKEVNQYAYLQYGYVSKDQSLNIQTGIRYEGLTKILDENLPKEKKHNYVNFLPSVNLNYYRGNFVHGLHYTMTLSYPSFNDLAYGNIYFNSHLNNGSNIHLKQTTSHLLGYDLNYKWMYFSLNYEYEKDPMVLCFDIEKTENNILVQGLHKNENLNHSVTVLGYFAPTFKFYEPILNLTYSYNNFRFPVASNKEQGEIYHSAFGASLTNSFNLPKSWFLSLDLAYYTKGFQYYFTNKPISRVGFSVQKSFFKNALRATIKAHDIFDGANVKTEGVYKGVNINSYAWTNNRYVSFTLTWYFNKYKKLSENSSLSTILQRL